MAKAEPDELGESVHDYRWLLDRGYPVESSVKFVGDRYRLGREDRLVLFRGVVSFTASERRRSLLVVRPLGRDLLVDGYNQIFTVTHYLDGRRLFLSTDGLLRDAGAAHGRVAHEGSFFRAMEILAAALVEVCPRRVFAHFDAPVSGSAGHARAFVDLLRSRGVEADFFLDKSADFPLKAAPSESVVATSDSAIADALFARGAARLFDAARFALERSFGVIDWLDLRSMAESIPEETGG